MRPQWHSPDSWGGTQLHKGSFRQCRTHFTISRTCFVRCVKLISLSMGCCLFIHIFQTDMLYNSSGIYTGVELLINWKIYIDGVAKPVITRQLTTNMYMGGYNEFQHKSKPIYIYIYSQIISVILECKTPHDTKRDKPVWQQTGKIFKSSFSKQNTDTGLLINQNCIPLFNAEIWQRRIGQWLRDDQTKQHCVTRGLFCQQLSTCIIGI